MLAFPGVAAAAQPFFAALLQKLFPQRPVVVVTENLKTQESFQQDLETWLVGMRSCANSFNRRRCFFRPGKFCRTRANFPTPMSSATGCKRSSRWPSNPEGRVPRAPPLLVVTSVAALLQKTFAPDDLKKRTRRLKRGDKIAPLDLIEWLEEQGYEPEAQVTQKGEIALRGGIVDIFPPTSPWPVRLEFFGDELESLRHFDPLTQISREEISEVAIPPAGEMGILKRSRRASQARTRTVTVLVTCHACWTICRAKRFFFCANRNAGFRAENTRSKFRPTIRFSFPGRIFSPN